MRPLTNHGVIHTVQVTQQNKDDLIKHLQIPENRKKWLEPGTKIHVVREADQPEHINMKRMNEK